MVDGSVTKAMIRIGAPQSGHTERGEAREHRIDFRFGGDEGGERGVVGLGHGGLPDLVSGTIRLGFGARSSG